METKCRNSIHAELTQNRIAIEKPFTVAGRRELDRLRNWKINLFLKEMEHIQQTIRQLDSTIAEKAESIDGCRLLMSIPGIGPYSSLLIFSEIGDISRSHRRTNSACMPVSSLPSGSRPQPSITEG